MRAFSVAIILLLASPLATASLLTTPPTPSIPLPPLDVRDGDVLLMLGREMGLHPTRLGVPVVPIGLDLPTMVQRLGERAGTPVAAEDAARFATLDPAIATPVLTLLVAMDQAWTIRDAAFSDVSDEELRAAYLAHEAGQPVPALATPDDLEMLLNAAIMLSDTLDSLVLPQLDALADAPVWPASAVADPVGILRIGGTGDDVETIDRFLQIDPRGDDEYYNNAGGAAAARDLGVGSLDAGYVVAYSLDLSGEDSYVYASTTGQGSAFAGLGGLLDLQGNDQYDCSYCMGSATSGIGLFRDAAGSDQYIRITRGVGYGDDGLGYFREDAGHDFYRGAGRVGGAGTGTGLGLYWDRDGSEKFEAAVGDSRSLGWSEDGGRGWYVDEGTGLETWVDTANHGTHPHFCNDCTWTDGAGGRGNDNYGGLAYLVAKQEP